MTHVPGTAGLVTARAPVAVFDAHAFAHVHAEWLVDWLAGHQHQLTCLGHSLQVELLQSIARHGTECICVNRECWGSNAWRCC